MAEEVRFELTDTCASPVFIISTSYNTNCNPCLLILSTKRSHFRSHFLPYNFNNINYYTCKVPPFRGLTFRSRDTLFINGNTLNHAVMNSDFSCSFDAFANEYEKPNKAKP